MANPVAYTVLAEKNEKLHPLKTRRLLNISGGPVFTFSLRGERAADPCRQLRH